MKKYCLYIIAFLQFALGFGQEIKAELPNVIPPSPTVAGLMKFEEVPVSNYTGTPEISVPLFSTKARFGLDFSITMSYSPSGIKKDDIAGYTGLGWNLVAGGSISRTIRDIPDEAFLNPTSSNPKIGIYHNDSGTSYLNNNYYAAMAKMDSTYNYITTYREDEDINRFLFEANEKGKFDTKHDLYQFNFMGHSGRFIIEKQSNGTFQVVTLDKSNLIISYNSTNRTFEIKDTKGFTYIFDVKELSTSQYFNVTQLVDGEMPPEAAGTTYLDMVTAFHLSKVKYGNETVVEFLFNEGFLKEEQTVRNWTYNLPVLPSRQVLANAAEDENDPHVITNGVLPLLNQSTNTIDIKTKKIVRINIPGRAVIILDNAVSERADVGLRNPELIPYLHSVTIKDWNENTSKIYTFDYLFGHKMFLDKITEGSAPNTIGRYQFKYKDLDLDYDDFEADYWGYYKLKQNCDSYYENPNRDTDKAYCKKDVLQQIIYPTGGSAVFEFEPNTYSHIGDFEVPEDLNQGNYFESFLSNPDNYTISNFDSFTLTGTTMPTGSVNRVLSLGVFSSNRTFILNTTVTQDQNNLGFLFLKKRNLSTNVTTSEGINTNGCPKEITINPGYEYKVELSWSTNGSFIVSAAVDIKEKTTNSTLKQYLYGGGIRIKNIYYTDNDAQELLYQDYPANYSKKVNYDYGFFGQANSSSGSLVFPKPRMDYEMTRRFDYMATSGPSSFIFMYPEIQYRVYSKSNNLSFISTKGSDVGYKNVTVRESGNGWSEYIYKSPIDHSEGILFSNYPFNATRNLDYKRGLLMEERKYDQGGRILSKNINTYAFENHNKITGVTLKYTDIGCPYAGKFSRYQDYRDGVLDEDTYMLPNGHIVGNLLHWNVKVCGDYVTSFVGYELVREAYGWAKLTNSVAKQYFYDASNTQTEAVSTTSFAYNNSNMQLATRITTDSAGDTVQNTFYYTIDTALNAEPQITTLRNANMVETLLLAETSKNSIALSKQKIIYNSWSGLLAPQLIQDSKGAGSLENRVRFEAYDAYANPLQMRQEDGTITSYIWGYHNSQPIAKIENAAYAGITPSLITTAQTKSNTSVTGLEGDLITALQAIRNALPNAMVTTFTHRPLFGLSTVTDPKGSKAYYEYDSFGRLATVKDNEENIISENEYHYKN